jgi:DNA gyrase/topoisomerase IV subunit A
MDVIASELSEIKKKHATPRRTRLLNASPEIVIEDAAAREAEDVVVVLQKGGYVKRIPQKIIQRLMHEGTQEDSENVLSILETVTDFVQVKEVFDFPLLP